MKSHDLIQHNEHFVRSMGEVAPDYFLQLSQGQQPELMMLACSDSRVSPSVVTRAPLGTLFLHRNVANQVVEGDASFEAGLWFALTTLGVKRIVVKGHTGCGGIAAACGGEAPPPLENWLQHVRRGLKPYLDDDPDLSLDDLSRANVLEQVKRLKEHPVFKAHGQHVTIEGYLLQLETGKLERLVVVEPAGAETP